MSQNQASGNYPLPEKLTQDQQDLLTDWFEAGEIDDFILEKKLLRVGCRPILTKLSKCLTMSGSDKQYQCEVNRSLTFPRSTNTRLLNVTKSWSISTSSQD